MNYFIVTFPPPYPPAVALFVQQCIAVTQHLTRKKSRKEDLINSWFKDTVCHGGEGIVVGVAESYTGRSMLTWVNRKQSWPPVILLLFLFLMTCQRVVPCMTYIYAGLPLLSSLRKESHSNMLH